MNFDLSEEELEKARKKRISKYAKRYSKYLPIIEEEIKNILGDFPELAIECGDIGIGVLINRSSIFDFKFDPTGNFYLIEPKYNEIELQLDNIDVFRSIVIQFINKKLIPTTINFYNKKFIKNLPSKMKIENKSFDFSDLTEEWLKETFNGITEDIMNSEEMTNIKITPGKEFIATFDVDCGRRGIHRYGNKIRINDRGDVSVSLCEVLEGSGIEEGLEDAIKEKIK